MLKAVVHVIGALALVHASAQVRVDVSGVGATQYPIAIAAFDLKPGTSAPSNVADVVRGDLQRSGAFRLIDPEMTLADEAEINTSELRGRGADAVLTGSVFRLPDGRMELQFRLTDVVQKTPLGQDSLVVAPADLRYAGHRIADWVYEKLLSEKGIFSTRIAFVSKQGTRYRLNIADWDGENIQSPLTSTEPIISPSWSPDGNQLAYVSFELRKPVVYVHTLTTGNRRQVANFKGSNSAPAWSPDGKTLALALTRDGLSQVYLISSDGSGSPRRITSTSGIDTEPVFTPDGRSIYFTSDRGGSPQIYRMPIDGGDATRVTFSGSYNVSPRLSPDGKSLAYVTRREGKYLIALRDLASGNEQVISESGSEESPSFAPNGRWVMYATRGAGRDSLIAVSVDSRVRQRLSSSSGDIREPTWGPMPR